MTEPTERFQSVDRSLITTSPDDFLWRAGGVVNDAFVAELADALRENEGTPLPPLLVWRETKAKGHRPGRWIVLDGHQRLAAYDRVFWQKPIPVEIAEGDSIAALVQSFRAFAAHGRLCPSPEERADMLWRIVQLAAGSEREQAKKRGGVWIDPARAKHVLTATLIAELGGVSRRTVVARQGTLRKLQAMGERIPRSWKAAEALAEGRIKKTDTQETEEAEAKRALQALRQAARPLAVARRRFPEHFAQAIVEMLSDHEVKGFIAAIGEALEQREAEVIRAHSAARKPWRQPSVRRDCGKRAIGFSRPMTTTLSGLMSSPEMQGKGA